MRYGRFDMNPGPSLNPPEPPPMPELCTSCKKRPAEGPFREDITAVTEYLCDLCWLAAVTPYPCFDCFSEVAL